jgi:hypothetical protein
MKLKYDGLGFTVHSIGGYGPGLWMATLSTLTHNGHAINLALTKGHMQKPPRIERKMKEGGIN